MIELQSGEQWVVWRRRAGHSQGSAARLLGVHVATLNAVERGRRQRLPASAPAPELPTWTAAPDEIVLLARLRAAATQKQFAGLLHTTAQHVRSWENSRGAATPLPPEVLAQCLELLRAQGKQPNPHP